MKCPRREGMAPPSVMWYHGSVSNDRPARKGLVVLSLFFAHLAVSMCAAAVCSQETPDAERTDRPPPQPAIASRLDTYHDERCDTSRTIPRVDCPWGSPSGYQSPCCSDV